jgi:hypothetical protein
MGEERGIIFCSSVLPWFSQQGQDSISFPPWKPYSVVLSAAANTDQQARSCTQCTTVNQLFDASFGFASTPLTLALAIKLERIKHDVQLCKRDHCMLHMR